MRTISSIFGLTIWSKRLATRAAGQEDSIERARQSQPRAAAGQGTEPAASNSVHAAGNARRTGVIPDRIRVVILEDNRLVREGLAAILAAQARFTVIAAVGSATEGLLAIEQQHPDVVLLDAGLAERRRSRTVEVIRATAVHTRVIVMDLLPTHQDVIQFIKAGVSGFIMKDASVEEFVATIGTVAGGASVVPAALSGTLLSHIAHEAVTRRLPGVSDAVRMTKREREIMDLIAEGLSNKAIAKHVGVSMNTVKSHVHNILEKLALHSRLQIAAHTLKSESRD